MKKPIPPKTIQEVEDFIKSESLCVDPVWFWRAFSSNDWYDTNDKPIRNWKMKLYNLDKLQRSWGKANRCSHGSFGSCKKPGVYDNGRDRDGHPVYRCIDHKPTKELTLPSSMTTSVLKEVPSGAVNVNNRRNKQMDKLADSSGERP